MLTFVVIFAVVVRIVAAIAIVILAVNIAVVILVVTVAAVIFAVHPVNGDVFFNDKIILRPYF